MTTYLGGARGALAPLFPQRRGLEDPKVIFYLK
jgi:hypothetical protein